MLFTTSQAAYLLGVDPRSFTRWARKHGIAPHGRQRIGRSFVTWWAMDDLENAEKEKL